MGRGAWAWKKVFSDQYSVSVRWSYAMRHFIMERRRDQRDGRFTIKYMPFKE
jgi:hypothetical protein